MPHVPDYLARNKSLDSAGLTNDLNTDSRQIAALSEYVNRLPDTYQGGAPQWVAGPQAAGALVYDLGKVYRVKAALANGIAAPGTDAAHYEALSASAAAPANGSIDNTALAVDIKIGSLAGLRTAWGAAANAFASVQDFFNNLLGRTAALESRLANTSGTNTGDQDLSGIATNAAALSQHVADHANPHAVTAAQVGLGSVTNDAQVKRAEMGVAGGVGTLDANGKIDAAQLPDALLGALKYKGTYLFGNNRISSPDSTLNNAQLPAAAAANAGWYFIVQDSGVLNSKVYDVGDWLISNGVAGWNKIDNTDAVVSVAGRIGAVTLTTDDVPEKATNPAYKYFTDARALGAKLTGYVKDAGMAAYVAGTTTVQQWLQQMEWRVDQKVDKAAGQGLSSNDYTTAEKNKLAGLSNSSGTYAAQAGTTIDFAAAFQSRTLTAGQVLTLDTFANAALGARVRVRWVSSNPADNVAIAAISGFAREGSPGFAFAGGTTNFTTFLITGTTATTGSNTFQAVNDYYA